MSQVALPDYATEFVVGLLSTLIGAFFGFSLTLWDDRRRSRNRRRKERVDLLKSLKEDLQANLNRLGGEAKEGQAILAVFVNFAVENAVQAGALNLIDEILRLNIAEVQRDLKRAELYSAKLLSVTTFENAEERLATKTEDYKAYRNIVIDVEDSLRKKIPKVMNLIDERLEKNESSNSKKDDSEE